MNIVCVGAHQDDIELNCLGTLLKYQQSGKHTITNVTISNGDKGGQYDPSIPYEEIARIRIAEATKVAEALGGRYVCMGQSDEYIRDTDEVRNQLVDVLRESRADIVFVCPPVDYNTDHILRVITSPCGYAGCGTNNSYGSCSSSQTPVLYYMDAIAGLEWQPTHYVDISDVYEQKCALVNPHESQIQYQTWGGMDLNQYATIMSTFRGLQCQVKHAEAFKPDWHGPGLGAGNYLP